VKTRQYTTRTKGAQEAHEAIRPTYLVNRTIEGDNSQKRLYDLIWKRTIASQMSDAILEKTNITIGISNTTEKFIARGEVIKFDGFLKVYMESKDDDEDENQEGMLPPVSAGDKLIAQQIQAQQKFTQHPPRYTEASLVKKLEELGIGRPSTYAPTISTIQKREYVIREDREGIVREYSLIKLKGQSLTEEIKTENTGFEKAKLFPTDIGNLVNNFLMQYFVNILDYNFTADVELEFDEIAEGKLVWNKMIHDFYYPFHAQIEETLETSKKVSGEKLLGKDPLSGENISVRIGRYGPMVQIGDSDAENKPRFASLKKGQSIDTITLEEALELFKLPRPLGDYEDSEVIVSTGRFGPYVKHKSAFVSLAKTDDPMTIVLERAIELITEKRKKETEKTIREFPENTDMKILNGRYGAYISFKKQNYKIPKSKDPKALTLDDCLTIVKETEPSKPGRTSRKKK
jgi:DNA topoisomerase-1